MSPAAKWIANSRSFVQAADRSTRSRPCCRQRRCRPSRLRNRRPSRRRCRAATVSVKFTREEVRDITAKPDNDFLFGVEDPQGLRCPFGAHIRRANPRESLAPGSQEQLAITNRHRILRVGRRYRQADGERPGLFFMCLNADLERQFEFVQQTWLQAPSFHGLMDERDPIIGSRHPNAQTPDDGFSMPTRDTPVRFQGMPEFVRTLGGGYFFVPGRSLLRYLTRAPTRRPG